MQGYLLLEGGAEFPKAELATLRLVAAYVTHGLYL